MKIKTAYMTYDEVLCLPKEKHKKPRKPSFLLHTAIRLLSIPELWSTRFSYQKIGMERLKKGEPYLVLMNHSCFLDLKIASALMYPRPFNIICTSDGFVGKRWLMRGIGCIPTQKFVSDAALVRDMLYAAKKLKHPILMYPEASYSFDGTATTLPETLGQFARLLGIPVVMIRTYGAFTHQPLYNGLRMRRVPVRAEMEYLLSPEELRAMSPEEVQDRIEAEFRFDGFAWQRDENIRVKRRDRGEGLNRVLYRCPHCETEGNMEANGVTLVCTACKKAWVMEENGQMRAADGETEYPHIPDWYAWERACVRRELEAGTYSLDIPVDICVLADTRAIYRVGEGRLTHGKEGFHLTGCDGKLDYKQKPLASYSLYSDYFWYELGDMISIGNGEMLYYCFPKTEGDVVAKTRLATEELYALTQAERTAAKRTSSPSPQ